MRSNLKKKFLLRRSKNIEMNYLKNSFTSSNLTDWNNRKINFKKTKKNTK